MVAPSPPANMRHRLHPDLAVWLRGLSAHLGFQRAFAGDETSRNNLLQLVQLRWIAVAGQVITIAVATMLLKVTLPLAAMGGVLAALVVMNGASLLRLRSERQIDNSELFLVLVLDMAALTLQLYFSGGATNPFISLYLLQIILGAVLLEPWSVWALVGLTAVCFAALARVFQPLDIPGRTAPELLTLHIQGNFVCFLLDSVLLVVFVERISRNLRLRDIGLANLKQQAAEEDHIVRMGLLASGAAHELGTPLSTLSVILNDWRRMPQFATDPQLTQEIADMEGEVRRCKSILSSILLSAGETRGEAPMVVSVETFLEDVLEDWRGLHPSTVLDYLSAVDEEILIVSDGALRQAVFNVLENAAETSPDWVGLSAYLDEGMIVLQVRDKGAGFDADILANIGRPYNSTKGREGGGLGLFLVTNVVRKLGGAVLAANQPQGGATVTLALPLAALQIKGAKRDD
jgi:two-component system sensor histidine kinase RegB